MREPKKRSKEKRTDKQGHEHKGACLQFDLQVETLTSLLIHPDILPEIHFPIQIQFILELLFLLNSIRIKLYL